MQPPVPKKPRAPSAGLANRDRSTTRATSRPPPEAACNPAIYGSELLIHYHTLPQGRVLMRSVILLCSAVMLAAPISAPAQVVPVLPSPSQTAQGDISVTIYNNGRALVEDKRVLDLPAGRSRQEFRDVSAQIEPATVTLNGRGIGIIEQNFDFDLLSPAALMPQAVGPT